MSLTGARTYVGFGFGAIQAGLFLYEAFRSGNFGRLVVAEVLPEVVAAVRSAGGFYALNIAHQDRVEQATIGPVAIYNPGENEDRERLVEALAEAAEIGTAVPSVDYYTGDGPDSLAHVLARGLLAKAVRGGPPAVVYAAENHNHAAEILQAAVWGAMPEEKQAEGRAWVQFLNTVIGKMSGVVAGQGSIAAQSLAPLTAGISRAFLVEAFNRILISRIDRTGEGWQFGFRRGITVFEEKADLFPFEEAKLYGHNANHALAAYVGMVRGVRTITELQGIAGALPFLRAAAIQESGEALICKHGGVDPLFTPAGYQAYAEDLLARMVNPHLHDTVERVGRDPERKLGWDDRLIGTMRLALQEGVTPRRYAVGAAAALAAVAPAVLEGGVDPATVAEPLWRGAAPAVIELDSIIRLIRDGHRLLLAWRRSGFPDLESLYRQIAHSH